MESDAFAPVHTIHSSGSSSSSLSSVSSSSNDSHVDGSMKNLGLGGYKFKAIGGGSEEGSENDGFVSGEDEFESAPDGPIAGYPDEETLERALIDEERYSFFVDSSELSMPISVRPVAKVSEDGDGDDDEYLSEGLDLESEDDEGDLEKVVVGGVSSVMNLQIEGGVSMEDVIIEPKLSEDGADSSKVVKENGNGGSQEEAMDSKKDGTEAENCNSDESGFVIEGGNIDPEELGGETKLKDENPTEDSTRQLQDEAGLSSSNQTNSLAISNGIGCVENGAKYIDILLGLKKASQPDDSGIVEWINNSEVISAEDSVADISFSSGSNSRANADNHSDQNPVVREEKNIIDTLLEGLEGEKDIETPVSEVETKGFVEEAGSDLKQKERDLVNDGFDGSTSMVESEKKSSDEINETTITRQDLYSKEENNPYEEVDNRGYASKGDTEGLIFGSSEEAKQFLEEMEKASSGGFPLGVDNSQDHSGEINGQIVTDSDEEVNTDEEGDEKELFDSAALTALLKAAKEAGSNGGPITITSQDGGQLFSVERPAGLGSSLQSLKSSSRPNRQISFIPQNPAPRVSSDNSLSEEEKTKLKNLQRMRVKFMRLVRRLGVSMEDPLVAQVLYRMGLFAGRSSSELFSLDVAKATAAQLEIDGREDLNFSLNILVLGKTGVGKSATINSIFSEEKTRIDAFGPATTAIREISGFVNGVKIRVFDTPGLKTSGIEQSENRKILSSIQKITKNCPPDIVIYIDRLDSQTRDLNDLPLLKSISSILGPSIWRGAIVALTHAASAPPDGPSGSPMSYEVFVAQRSHILQQAIGQVSGDLRILNPTSMNPVSLVENHPSCRKNRDGQKVLPNGQTWRPQLLLLCYSIKILAEVSDISKPRESFDHKKLFGFRARSPPLPYLLSGLLQSRTHPKLASDHGGDNGDSDTELADLSDSDEEEVEDKYDQLPPFKPLRKAQIAKLSKEQRKAYLEEYDYRVKLLQKKQLREELKRMKEIKKIGKSMADDSCFIEEDDQENGTPAAVQVPLPDMVLPPSFDSDNRAFRYRFLEPSSQFLARPVLDNLGWDHDCGYDGVNLEHSLAIASRFPSTITAQITKDKKEFNLHLDSSVAAKHGDNISTMAGFDIQNIGRQLAYIVRGETKVKNFKKNRTAAGISVTFLGESICTGLKIEDQIVVGKRLVLVGSSGTVRSQSDSAFGANLEVRVREADYPIGQDNSSLGLSLVRWRGDMALGANLQSQFSLGRNYKVAVRAGLNNKMSGQITVRTSSSDQLQIALLAIFPVLKVIYKNFWPGSEGSYSIY